MHHEQGSGPARALPFAVIATIAIQTAGVMVWGGAANARLSALEARVEHQAGVAERLARLEEQAEATHQALDRIEAKLDREERP